MVQARSEVVEAIVEDVLEQGCAVPTHNCRNWLEITIGSVSVKNFNLPLAFWK